MEAKTEKPDLIERYADNGEHSHWELRGRTGILLWTEDEEEKEPIGFNGDHCKSCNGSGFGVIPDSTCLDCNGSGTDFASQIKTTPIQAESVSDKEIIEYSNKYKLFGEARIAIRAIEWMRDRLSQLKPTEGWISVEDRLPEVGELILMYRESTAIPDGYFASTGAYGFFKEGVWGNEEKDDWIVTHWQPLPAPPDKKEKEEKVLICENCKKFWIAPKEQCMCLSTTLTETDPSNAQFAENKPEVSST